MLSAMSTDPTPHLFWITSRAAGTAALVLSSLAVCIGLLMSTRLLRRKGPDLRVAHEMLSLATMVAIVVHAVTLLGDSFFHPTVAALAIPFVGSYKSVWTSIGIVSGWSMIALGLSYYARRRIGVARWRTLHRFTALAWLLGLGHSLGEGTDAGQVWFLAMVAIVAIPALGLLAMRMFGGERGTDARPPVSGARPGPSGARPAANAVAPLANAR